MENAAPALPKRVPDERHKKFWAVVSLLVLIHLLMGGALALFFQPSDNHIILHYNVYFGVDLLGAWWQVYLLPALSFTFLLGNVVMAYRFLKRGDWLLSLLLLMGSGIISLGLAIAVAAIVLVNY